MEKRKKAIVTLLILVSFTKLIAQYNDIVKIPFPRQYGVMDSVMNVLAKGDSVIAAKAISEMGMAAEQTKDELVLLNFKRSVFRYRLIRTKVINDTANNKAYLTELKVFLANVDEKKYPVIAALVNINIGNIEHFWEQQSSSAFNHYLKAYNLFKNVSIEEFPDRQYSQYSIALLYYQFNDYAQAVVLGKEIVALYPIKNPVSVFTEDLIGMSFLKLNQFDSAMVRFKWILNHCIEAGTSEAWKGIALGNIGKLYFLQERYNEAIPNLEEGLSICMQHGIHDNVAAFASPLSTIYIKQNNLPLAKKYVDIAKQAADSVRGLSEYYTVYAALSEYYDQTRNYPLAFEYLNASNIYRDSLERKNDQSKKFKAEMLIEKERASIQEQLLKDEKSKQILLRNGILIFAFLFMLIILLYFNRIRLKNLHREQQLMAQNKLAETELKNASNQLKDFTQSILNKNELIDKAASEMERMGAALKKLQHLDPDHADSPGEIDSNLQQLRQSVILTDDDWSDFSELLDKVHPGFLSRVKEKLPGLSPAEYRFVTLLKIKLNNKEMASMLGVGTDAIRQTRSRLKKKMEIGEEGNLEDIIEKV